MIDSFYKINENYYPEACFEEFKFEKNKLIKVHFDYEIKISSDKCDESDESDDSDEENDVD